MKGIAVGERNLDNHVPIAKDVHQKSKQRKRIANHLEEWMKNRKFASNNQQTDE